MSELQGNEFEVSTRPRKRRTSEEITRETFAEIQGNDPSNIPIVEVLDILSDSRGHIKYQEISTKAQNRSLLEFDGKRKPVGTLQNLSSAFAEATILKELRNGTPSGVAIFEPVAQASSLFNNLSAIDNPGIGILSLLGKNIIDSFRNRKTPDILYISPQFEIKKGKLTEIHYGSLSNIVNPKNPTNSYNLLDIDFRDRTLIAPVEVTIGARPNSITQKITKFRENYANPFPNNKKFAYVPVLVLDYDNFRGLSRKFQTEIVTDMNNIGGVVSLKHGLAAFADRRAISAAEKIIEAINSRQTKSALSQNNQQQLENFAADKNLENLINPQCSLNHDFSKSQITPIESPKLTLTFVQKPTEEDIKDFRQVLAALKEKIDPPPQKHKLFEDSQNLNAAQKQALTLGYSAILAIKDNDYSYGEKFVFQRKGLEVGIYRQGEYTQIAIVDLKQGEISINKSLNETEHSWLAEKESVMLAAESGKQQNNSQKGRGFEMG
jgi:hypothetical protein